MLWGRILGGIWLGLKWAWPYIRGVLVWAGVLTAHTAVMKTLWENAFSRLDSVVTGYTAQTINFSPLALINALFPLAECLTMQASYTVLVGACNAVRITKAFIDARKS